MKVGESRGGSVTAAVLAAAISGGGAYQAQQGEIDAANGRAEAAHAIIEQVDIHNPTIKSYIRHAAEAGITSVLEKKLISDRAGQMKMLAEDIAANIAQGETVPLNGLVQRLAEKVRIDDPEWLAWYSTNFANYLQSQIQTGLAVGNLHSEQLVRLVDVTGVMSATAELFIVPPPATLEADLQHAEKILAEDEASKSARVEAGTW